MYFSKAKLWLNILSIINMVATCQWVDWVSFWHACTSIRGWIIVECKDQSWFKVQAVPVFRFGWCKMFSSTPLDFRLKTTAISWHLISTLSSLSLSPSNFWVTKNLYWPKSRTTVFITDCYNRLGLATCYTLVSCSANFRPWRWRWYIPPKRQFAYGLHGAISQKMATFITTAVRAWNPAYLRLYIHTKTFQRALCHTNRGVLLSTLLHAILHPSHHLLNVLLQTANKLDLSNKKNRWYEIGLIYEYIVHQLTVSNTDNVHTVCKLSM
jgi:hypothetical protein